MTAAKIIYVDMDDVLCETARAWLVIAEREFGKTIPYDQLNTFELGEACGLETREIQELSRLAHHPEELLAMAPIDEAVSVLADWAGAGHEIAIITGRPPSTHDVSRVWLARHQSGLAPGAGEVRLPVDRRRPLPHQLDQIVSTD